MSIVISVNVPRLPTDLSKMDVESKKARIKLEQETGKPFVDDICRKLVALGINDFRRYDTTFSIVIFQDVYEEQLEIINSWEEVLSIVDGIVNGSCLMVFHRIK